MPDPVGTEHRARRRIAPWLIALTIPVVAAAQTDTPVGDVNPAAFTIRIAHGPTMYRTRSSPNAPPLLSLKSRHSPANGRSPASGDTPPAARNIRKEFR